MTEPTTVEAKAEVSSQAKPFAPLWWRILKRLLTVVGVFIAMILLVVIAALIYPPFKGRIIGCATFVVPPNMRPFLVQGLGRMGPDAIGGLTDVLKNHSSWEVRLEAAHELGMLKDKGGAAVPALTEAATADSEAAVRADAVWALGQIRAKGSTAIFSTALNDSEAKVRLKAVEAIAMAKSVDPELIPVLVKTLQQNADWQVSVAILESIAGPHMSKQPELKQAVEAAAKSDDEDVSETAKEILSESQPN